MTGTEPVVEHVESVRPDLADGLDHLLRTVGDGRFDPEILAVCRGRIGTLLRCPVHARPLPRLDELTSTARACVSFTETFVMDHHGITDQQAADVVDRVGSAAMVAFTAALAVYEGTCRFERTLPRDKA